MRFISIANGVVFATVKTDRTGFADLNLRSVTDDSGGDGSIPKMSAGDKISVAGIGSARLRRD